MNDGVAGHARHPSKVIYTADPGVSIKAGQFQEFPVALDLTPDTGSVEFPTIQTYSNGDGRQAWNEPTLTDGQEPDNPAPTLYINDPPPTDTESGVTIAATMPRHRQPRRRSSSARGPRPRGDRPRARRSSRSSAPRRP